MRRSMMQVFVSGSAEALEFYKKAFNAEIKCAYPDDRGRMMHAELNVNGQILAVMELPDGQEPVTGNTMMFCLHFGAGMEDEARRIYGVLSEGAREASPLDENCGYSPLQFVLTDKYGVWWCIFV